MTMALSAPPTDSLEEEILRLEEELERKKLEDQIRQMEEQMKALQQVTPPSEKAPAVSTSLPASSNLAVSNHSANSMGISHHSNGASSTEYEEQIVEFSEGGTEYEVVTECMEEEVSESQNFDQMEVIEELTEAKKTDAGTKYEESEDEEELLLPPPQTTAPSSVAPSRAAPPQTTAASPVVPVKVPPQKAAPAPVTLVQAPPPKAAPTPVTPVKAPGVVGSVLMPPNGKRLPGIAKAAAPAAPSTAKQAASTTPVAPAATAPDPAEEAETKQKGGLFRRLVRKKVQPPPSTSNSSDPLPAQEEVKKPAPGKKVVRKVRRVVSKPGNEADAVEVKTPPKPFIPRTIAASPPSPEGQETPLELLVGTKLMTPSRTTKVSTLAAMQGQELVSLYFGAKWRTECKRFVPMLSKFYKACGTMSQNFEAIYVSVDRTLLEFNDCYGRMPWLAMPTGTTPFKNGLTEQLKVIDLPALVVLDPKTGHVVTTNGVAEIEALGDFDATGAIKLVQKWKKTKPVPASDLKIDTTLKNGNMERGIVRWET
jgi:nucleoredoxin